MKIPTVIGSADEQLYGTERNIKRRNAHGNNKNTLAD